MSRVPFSEKNCSSGYPVAFMTPSATGGIPPVTVPFPGSVGSEPTEGVVDCPGTEGTVTEGTVGNAGV